MSSEKQLLQFCFLDLTASWGNTLIQIEHYKRASSEDTWVVQTLEDYHEGVLLIYLLLNVFYFADESSLCKLIL